MWIGHRMKFCTFGFCNMRRATLFRDFTRCEVLWREISGIRFWNGKIWNIGKESDLCSCLEWMKLIRTILMLEYGHLSKKRCLNIESTIFEQIAGSLYWCHLFFRSIKLDHYLLLWRQTHNITCFSYLFMFLIVGNLFSLEIVIQIYGLVCPWWPKISIDMPRGSSKSNHWGCTNLLSLTSWWQPSDSQENGPVYHNHLLDNAAKWCNFCNFWTQ